MKSRILTLQQLIDAKACQSQIDQFREDFGDSVRVTIAIARKHAQRYDFSWASGRLLSPGAQADCEAKRSPLRADYEAKRATMRADYEAKRATMRADCEAKRATMRADCEAKHATMRADYEAKCASLRADYETKWASLWATAYINDKE